MLMQASRCICGKIVPLKRDLCPNCGKLMISIDIGNKAKILTHTTLYTVPEDFESPIFLALVELDRGVKLLCECKSEKFLKIDMRGKIVEEDKKYYFIGDIK
jgi:uncharacterized OB-fold protein